MLKLRHQQLALDGPEEYLLGQKNALIEYPRQREAQMETVEERPHTTPTYLRLKNLLIDIETKLSVHQKADREIGQRCTEQRTFT